jgi:hypothetical protein
MGIVVEGLVDVLVGFIKRRTLEVVMTKIGAGENLIRFILVTVWDVWGGRVGGGEQIRN